MPLSKEEKEIEFLKKSKKMKQAHLVCLEVNVDKLFLNHRMTQIVTKNCDIVKIRVKFGNFPCAELKGTYEEEFVPGHISSVRTIFGTEFMEEDVKSQNKEDDEDLDDEELAVARKKKKVKKVRFNEDYYKSGPRKSSLTETDEGIIAMVKEVKTRESAMAEEDEFRQEQEEEEEKEKCENEGGEECEKLSKIPVNSNLIIVKPETGIPFNDTSTLIFSITPHQLLYELVNKPLMLFLIMTPTENDSYIIGQCDISLYQMSDVVAHMISVDGGVSATSNIAGTYFVEETIPSGSPAITCTTELSKILVRLQLSTHGVGSCASMSWNEEDGFKYILDEWVLDPKKQMIPRLERDVWNTLPILTGNENIIDVQFPPKPNISGHEHTCNCLSHKNCKLLNINT